MKKTVITLLIFMLLLPCLCSCEGYRVKEELMEYPGLDPQGTESRKHSYEVACFQSDLDSRCILMVWGFKRGICNGQLYNNDMQPITKEFSEFRGCFFVNGNNYFIFIDEDEKGKFTVICDEEGKIILPEGKRYDVIYSESHSMSDPTGLYLREQGNEHYYYYDCERLELTDFIYHKERLKWEKSEGIDNIYDVVAEKYLFDRKYSEISYKYMYKKYWFTARDEKGCHLFFADDSEGKLEIKEYTQKVFETIEFIKHKPPLKRDKAIVRHFIRCSSPQGNMYLDEKGNEVTGEWLELALSGITDDIDIAYPAPLPEGMEIRYGDEYVEYDAVGGKMTGRNKAFFSQGRQITPYTPASTKFQDGYYIEWSGFIGGEGYNIVYDIEGNEVYRGHGIQRVVNNKMLCFELYAHDAPGIHKITVLNPAPKIYINGEFMLTDTLPRIKNGRTLVPLRAFAEMMEFQVKEPDETGRIEISKEGKTVAFTLGSLEGEKDGEKFKLEAAPEIINNRTLVPLRALAEAFECEVEWNGETTEVVIKN